MPPDEEPGGTAPGAIGYSSRRRRGDTTRLIVLLTRLMAHERREKSGCGTADFEGVPVKKVVETPDHVAPTPILEESPRQQRSCVPTLSGYLQLKRETVAHTTFPR